MGVAVDLMRLPPDERRQWIADLDADDVPAVLAALRHEYGTPYYAWVDDPVGFIEDVLGEFIWSRQKMIARSVATNRRTAVSACHAPGKALADGTPILTPTGWRPIETLRSGDTVVAGDGTPTTVLAVYPQGVRPLVRVTFKDGATIVCDPDHLWPVTRRRGVNRGNVTVETTDTIRRRVGDRPWGWARPAITAVAPVEMPPVPVPDDPYTVGGHAADPGRSSARVPSVYIWNDTATRRALLRGIMDTVGTVDDHGVVEYVTTDPTLADTVAFLAGSLGAIVERPASARVRWSGGPCPFALARKRDRWEHAHAARKCTTTQRLIVAFDDVAPGPATCIRVNHPDGTYVTDRFVVTHNTHHAARLVAWWMSTHAPGTAKAITTATSWKQVRNQLWPHIVRVGDGHQLPGYRNQTEWGFDNVVYAYGFAANRYDEASIQGTHAENLLVIIDEAGGIVPLLGAALDGLSTGENTRILAIGNPPTDEDATWFESICDSPLWNHITIPASTTPNFTGEPVPERVARQLVDPRWVNEVRITYGTDSAFYIARVDALFPKVFAQKVVPVLWCEEAMDNDHPDRSGWQRLGVDVAAEGGDEMVVAYADGFTVRVADHWSGADSADQVVNAERVLGWIRRAEGRQKQLGYDTRRVRVKLDGIGIGSGTTDILERMGKDGLHNADIVKVKVSESPLEPEKFERRRDEAWWTLRELIQSGSLRLEITNAEKAQITGPMWKSNKSGKTVVEAKVKMKSRGIPSPDRADAICLAVYEPITVVETRSHASQLRDRTMPRDPGSGIPGRGLFDRAIRQGWGD